MSKEVESDKFTEDKKLQRFFQDDKVGYTSLLSCLYPS